MWQLFALGSLLAGAGTSVADKFGLVHDTRVDNVIAVLLRTIFFLIAISLIGLWGFLGPVQFFFHPLLLIICAVSLVGSFAYTFALRHVEITEIGVIGYVLPFVFFGIDSVVLGTQFSAEQVSGMVLLILGGLAFSLDGKTHHLSKQLSVPAISVLAIMGISTGVHAYGFKYLNAHEAINGVSFYMSAESIILGFLILVVILRGKISLLWSRATIAYIPPSVVGKSFDALSSVLWVQALTLATVSQVATFQALSPLVLFVVVAIGQLLFRFTLKEKLDRPRAVWKAGAVCLLVAGGFLVT